MDLRWTQGAEEKASGEEHLVCPIEQDMGSVPTTHMLTHNSP